MGESSRVRVPAPNSALHSGRRDTGLLLQVLPVLVFLAAMARRFVFPFLVVLLVFFLSFLVSALLTVVLAFSLLVLRRALLRSWSRLSAEEHAVLPRSGLVSHATAGESERIIGLRESAFSSSESPCTSHNSRIHGVSSRVCVGPFSCSAAGVSAFASVLGARSTCRALPASVVPCMSLDDSPMHDARNSRGAVFFLSVCKSTSYNLDVGRQGPTWRRVPKVGFPVRPKICDLSQRWRQG